MKALLKFAACILLTATLILGFATLSSFQKVSVNQSFPGKNTPASSHSSDVLDKWMAMQIKLMSTTVASFNGPFVRIYAYSGLAAYESVSPGILKKSSYLFSSSVLNRMPAMPETETGKNYHWPSSMNAALAFMNRAMFPYTSPDNKAAIDSLETNLKIIFSREVDSATIERSIAFGKMTAQKIFDWSETDGYRFASNPYIPPVGPGKWIPTPPGFVKAVTPYWGNLRTMVEGSIENTQPPAPPVYSEDTASEFYKMVRGVYDGDRNLSPEQKAIALFWKDINPGITAPGHWLNILRQVFQKEKTRLDKAAFTYALSGMALNDAWISCWKTRYDYNLLRPVTYIRNVMGYGEWLPILSTPPHPEYTSGFACMAGAVAQSLTSVFGKNYSLTDHTYDYLGMMPRTFDSFLAMAEEAGNSKFYGGIHYKLSVDAGLQQGIKVAQHVESALLNKRKPAKP
jgi:hypothetical protein